MSYNKYKRSVRLIPKTNRDIRKNGSTRPISVTDFNAKNLNKMLSN